VFVPWDEQPNWRRVWAYLLALWMAFAILGTWMNYGIQAARSQPISWGHAVGINVAAYGIWAFLLTPIVLLVCAAFPLRRARVLRFVTAHLLGITATVFVDVLAKTALHKYVYPELPALPVVLQWRHYFFLQTEADVQIYLVVAVLGYVVAYYAKVRMEELRASRLETNLVKAELQLLKMQLQPHFLFNTLHSISSQVFTDPRAAQKMICSLGDLLRLSLAGEDLPEVTLRRELEFLKLYLDIEKMRFQDRLLTKLQISDEVLEAKVPYLLLQPLVENAIKHGVSRRSGSGSVEVAAFRDSGRLRIVVTNDRSTSSAFPVSDGMGIGLENARNRLRILYGDDSRLSVRDLPGSRFEVKVDMPLRFMPAPDKAASIAEIETSSISEPSLA
jgi:two-component system LytT family sensor kinase